MSTYYDYDLFQKQTQAKIQRENEELQPLKDFYAMVERIHEDNQKRKMMQSQSTVEQHEETSTQISVISVEVIKEISVEVPVEVVKEISVNVPVEVIKEVEVTKEISVEIPVETIKEISVEVPRYISVEVTSNTEQMKLELLSSILDKMECLSSSNFGMAEINRNLSSIIFQNDNPKPVPIYYA